MITTSEMTSDPGHLDFTYYLVFTHVGLLWIIYGRHDMVRFSISEDINGFNDESLIEFIVV